MTYRLLLFSEEVENFVMEIIAPASATFHELHTLILNECAYTEKGNHRFLICNDSWKVKEKIHLHDSGKMDYDEDLYLMKDTILDDFIEETNQHIAYVYDTESKSTFLMELTETIFGEKAEKAYIRRRKGTPPPQFRESDEMPIAETTPTPQPQPTIAEPDPDDIFDEETFSEDEIDTEGFEVSEA